MMALGVLILVRMPNQVTTSWSEAAARTALANSSGVMPCWVKKKASRLPDLP
ncbi:hypothetical protein D3C86_2166340 [compost metagenome]